MVWARPAEPQVSLDEVQDSILTSQSAALGHRVKPHPSKVVVDRTGRIALKPHGESTPRGLAEVTAETFASPRPSLDRIRDQMLQSQQAGEASPSNPRQKIVADRNGRIGFEEDLSDGRALSEVTQEVFASRLAKDRLTVARQLPTTTREVAVQGVPGWQYRFENEFGEVFAMWAFFDGGLYQVALVEPRVDARRGGHDKHLFLDGYLCLSPRGGCRTLSDAYARSVMWANGFTVYERTGKFPFSINNL